jgi:hypothetical protein
MEKRLGIKMMADIVEADEKTLDGGDVTPNDPLTLDNILERFPVLKRVLWISKYFKPRIVDDRFEMYSYLKYIAAEFVGWSSPDANYATEKAYDIVTDKIIENLNIN